MLQRVDVAELRSAIRSQGLTQKDLADLSGISRAQISRILSADSPVVRESTVHRLSRTLKLATSRLLVGETMREYRQRVASEHGRIDFRGIGMPDFEGRRIPIEKVFVDLRLEEDILPQKKEDDECEAIASKPQDTPRPMAATDCLRTLDRVVVLGHPGSGKTTLLRYFAHTYAISDDESLELPIYVRLAEFARAQEIDENLDLVSFVASRGVSNDSADFPELLHNELVDDKRRCLVLLDGLDEVGERKECERVIRAVKSFVKKYPGNHYVVTSRIVGFERGSWKYLGFVEFRVLPYNRKQLRTFAEKWASLLSGMQGRSEASVLEEIKTAFMNPRVRSLAENPLILTILVLLSGARGGALPRRRVDLYEKVVDVFLDTWEKSKRPTETLGQTASVDLDAREFRWLLSDLAFAMQKVDLTLAPRWWLAERLRQYLQDRLGFESKKAQQVCDRIIRYVVERTGLIEERGRDLFSFSHRTLQEYFASLGVIDEADATHKRDVADCLRQYFYHPQWCEVVRLVAAQLTPPLADQLITAICDDPDPVGRFLKRGPLLALRCLSDGTTIARRQLTSSIFNSLLELGSSKWLGITIEAFGALADLEGAPRFERQAKETIEGILTLAKEELDGDEYDCLYRFVELPNALEAASDKLECDLGDEAAREISIQVGDETDTIRILNMELSSEKPDAWFRSARSIVESEEHGDEIKQLIVRELGRRVRTDRRSRVFLRKLLTSSASISLRVAAALALAFVASTKDNVKRLLTKILDNESNEQVLEACATSLGEAAESDKAVRDRLVQLYDGSGPKRVRVAAAHALATVASNESSLTERLLGTCVDRLQPEELRIASAWSLEPQIGTNDSVTCKFIDWLDEHEEAKLQRVAAQSLAIAMGNDRIPWDHRVVESAENILMNLSNPCPHALRCLEEIARARELRGGLRLETVLANCLKPISNRIDLAFVFGSTARRKQTEESDIDLFVIGAVGLKDLATPLRRAENALGRRINPVIYTRDSFRQKYQAGDPFLLDVYRKEKISIQCGVGLSREGLYDELRAMVAEQMASTM